VTADHQNQLWEGSAERLPNWDECAKNSPQGQKTPLPRPKRGAPARRAAQFYFGGGAGVNPSRLCAGSGLGFGLGAFLTSFLPLSLLPMAASVLERREGRQLKEKKKVKASGVVSSGVSFSD